MYERCRQNKTERGEYLPLKILLNLLKDIKSNESNTEYVQQCYYTLKIVMRTNSKPLDEYIMNDSDLIEIIMAKLNNFYHSLPERISKREAKKLHFKPGVVKFK